MHERRGPKIYCLLAEFRTPEAVLHAAKSAYAQGYRRMEAYSPLPVDGLAEAIGFERNRIPMVVLIGGIVGGVLGYFMQWYSAVVNYPLNIGGRPFHSWPSFIPITFETTVLMAAFAAVFGMLALNGLPRPHHPVFSVERFALASRSRFFLSILADDPLFDTDGTTTFLEGLNPREVNRVEN
jgi:hypothetical protein